jgi:hypothetical protein
MASGTAIIIIAAAIIAVLGFSYFETTNYNIPGLNQGQTVISGQSFNSPWGIQAVFENKTLAYPNSITVKDQLTKTTTDQIEYALAFLDNESGNAFTIFFNCTDAMVLSGDVHPLQNILTNIIFPNMTNSWQTSWMPISSTISLSFQNSTVQVHTDQSQTVQTIQVHGREILSFGVLGRTRNPPVFGGQMIITYTTK